MRLFVAAWDDGFVDEVGRRWSEVAAGEPFRRVRAEGLHATFAFLGEVDGALLSRLTSAIDQAASHIAPFTLALDRVGALGRDAATRVWVLRGESEAYEHATGRIRRLLGFALPEERRRPIPHVTLARSRDPIQVQGRPVVPPIGLTVRAITLFESFLEPGGARYEVRHVAPLAGRPAD